MSLLSKKKRGGTHDLEVSMVGIKLGSTVLQIGGQDAQLVTALAKIVGISGEVSVAVESAQDADRVALAAKSAGVFIDVQTTRLDTLTYNSESFDVVVAANLLGDMRMNERVLCLQQTLKVLKPNGRCVVIEAAPRGGLGILLSKRTFDPTYLSYGGAEGALKAEGFRSVRLLAEREGKCFYEGTK